MEQLITGYQWGINNVFIGKYVFPKNLDKDEIHLPYNTTIVAPLESNDSSDEIFWNGISWEIRKNKNKH